MNDPIATLRLKLSEESFALNVARVEVSQAQEDLAEAESRYRAKRERVSKLIEEINGLERTRIIGEID